MYIDIVNYFEVVLQLWIIELFASLIFSFTERFRDFNQSLMNYVYHRLFRP